MPHKMETFNHIDFNDVDTSSIPPFVLENNDNHGKTYYPDSLILGPEYREDESTSKEIQHLMKLERHGKETKEKSRSFSKKTKRKFLSEARDDVKIYPDGVIFDEKKLGSS
ncbi:hypothetical protein Tco_0761207 [Tanacetum coccineum]